MKTKIVFIEGYLIQRKLEAALRDLVGPDNWLGRELRVPGTRRRWDMAFKQGGRTIVVEFDGDQHYRDALVIRADYEKDAIANELGYQIVRIPYWVQLTTQTLYHYFHITAEVVQDFRHGFISDPPVLPASYCQLGLVRFKQELDSLPLSVRQAVILSLQNWVPKYGEQYVYPDINNAA